MPVVVNLDVMLARRKVRSNELARAVGITESNLSLLKSGRVKGVRFSTLAAICRYLDCEPGDILGYEPSDEDLAPPDE
ncbi:MAG: putative transcriptional regulator [Sphingomonadales bacterium]|jgi:putative transcriptional regulator|nr:putative transcriptional regulator [Sphingomonadales bacterium]